MYVLPLLTKDRWCVRCAHAFRTPHARNQHIRDSVNHHKCPACDFDGASWDDLLEHCRNEGCRTVCRDCDNGVGMHWVAQSNEYLEHVDKFNVCTECERHFTSPGRLHQVGYRTCIVNERGMLKMSSIDFLTVNRSTSAINALTCLKPTVAW
jgi:DNA-directed RNA polymerase subunit M/transcription elongation factor TFIIS